MEEQGRKNNKIMKTLYFDLLHLYYLPQFLPVADLLQAKGVSPVFVVYEQADISPVAEQAVAEAGYTCVTVKNKSEAIDHYAAQKPDWVIFGNRCCDEFASLQQKNIRLAFMNHGIGPKACYFDTSKFPFDVRFVEGGSRFQRLQDMYPNNEFKDVGYAKLDPLFNAEEPELSLLDLDLDPNKPTILYAPTFFPSSIECFAKQWPQEMAQYNLIIKPHFFSLTKSKYAKQRKLIKHWSTFSNVYIAPISDYSLLPFMNIADIMMSEVSSAVFEFAAMDKPVVWCDFYHLRWSYRGPFKYRLDNRLDDDLAIFHKLCERAESPQKVKEVVAECVRHPDKKSAARKQITKDMVGVTDGKCSQRIVDYLLNH